MFSALGIPIMWYPPSTTIISPDVNFPASEIKYTAVPPTASRVALEPRGALSSVKLYVFRAPPTAAPAKVLIGPGDIALTRILSGPRSEARYLVVHSNPALAMPITL